MRTRIASADKSCIQQHTSIGTMKLIKQQIADAELHHDMLLIASTCHYKFMSGRTNVHIRSGDLDLKHNPYYYDKTEMMEFSMIILASSMDYKHPLARDCLLQIWIFV